jgi:hypothetical protein
MFAVSVRFVGLCRTLDSVRGDGSRLTWLTDQDCCPAEAQIVWIKQVLIDLVLVIRKTSM